MENPDPSATSGFESVVHHLDAHGVAYEVVEHDVTSTAVGDAAASNVDPAAAGKTLVLHDHRGYSLAVVPADQHLDIAHVRELTGASSHLRLASEEEMARDLPLYEVGAVPPIGPRLPAIDVVDVRLVGVDRALFAAGDHRHSLLVSVSDLLRLAEPRVADVCEVRDERDPEDREGFFPG
ncbi:aminoacyl-tRNA deacylase [Conexibacter arvalis]|uniref:Ala-tRNA(Pro) deacylase n=1 Tax=Conexibacter arvalis TaxID=912552 RepID=A0A840IFC5_9ACTN|nr:YbaK/EbsC family protein [Conexibacter arvalis]MBB4663529.1 Ala-tRNA(Pro) deacylase [Conexibacter arvalis]